MVKMLKYLIWPWQAVGLVIVAMAILIVVSGGIYHSSSDKVVECKVIRYE